MLVDDDEEWMDVVINSNRQQTYRLRAEILDATFQDRPAARVYGDVSRRRPEHGPGRVDGRAPVCHCRAPAVAASLPPVSNSVRLRPSR